MVCEYCAVLVNLLDPVFMLHSPVVGVVKHELSLEAVPTEARPDIAVHVFLRICWRQQRDHHHVSTASAPRGTKRPIVVFSGRSLVVRIVFYSRRHCFIAEVQRGYYILYS